MQVWDVLTGKLTKKIEMSKGEPVALVLSPDAGMAAASHLDGSIELWDVRTGKNVVHLPGQGKIRFPLGLAPGQRLAFFAERGNPRGNRSRWNRPKMGHF